MREIRRGRPGTPIEELPLSPGAKSLPSALLTPDPERRMSCKAAAEHYWVRENGVAKTSDALATTVVERLQAFGTLGAVRRASVRAAFDAANAGSFEKLVDDEATRRLVEAVDEAAPARATSAASTSRRVRPERFFRRRRTRRERRRGFLRGRPRGRAGARAPGPRRRARARGVAQSHPTRHREQPTEAPRARRAPNPTRRPTTTTSLAAGAAFVENAALAAIFAVPPPESGSGVLTRPERRTPLLRPDSTGSTAAGSTGTPSRARVSTASSERPAATRKAPTRPSPTMKPPPPDHHCPMKMKLRHRPRSPPPRR